MKTLIIYTFCFLIPLFGYSQNTYSFRYKIDATDDYKNLTNKNIDFYAVYGISMMRKHFYSTVYMDCIANDQYLETQNDLNQFLKGYDKTFDTNDVKNYDINLGGVKNSDKLTFNTEGIDTVKYLRNKHSNITYRIVNDTIDTKSVCKLHKKDDFIKTNDTQTINGWLCTKWVPTAQDITDKVSIWISKSVPKEINMGIIYNNFEGGLVKIEWINGRFNWLTEYKTIDSTYNFNYKKLPVNRKKSKSESDFLRDALIENDSMEVIVK